MTGRGGTFELVEHAGGEPGPTVTVIGGIHGDEDEGVLAVQRLGLALQGRPLARGSVRAVPIAHPAAYDADQRVSPLDRGNLARSFPGDAKGSATERIAHDLTERAIRGSDLLIDLHSAGRAYAMPTFAGYVENGDDVSVRSRRAAVAFGAPLLWEHSGPAPSGRTLSTAIELGIPCIYVEGSGGGSVERDELDVYVGGVLRVLADLEMLSWEPPIGPGLRRVVRGEGGNLDAGITTPTSGRFVSASAPGDVLAAGDHIGEVVDALGRTAAEISAPADCTVMFLRRTARIEAGEVLCAVGPPAVAWSAA
ncbi:MAG: hypothetical protein V7607_5667 [Solirubrobacteraceae bacterium]